MREIITWIDIDTSLPPNDETILICQSDGVVFAGIYDGEWWAPGDQLTFDGELVAYWAEMPKGP